MVVYPANLCLILRDVEFAGKREDFGEAIGKAIEIASDRAVGQSAAEHFHNMLRGTKRVKDAVEIGAGGEGVSFGRWRKVSGARAGHFELALHIGRNNVQVAYGHRWRGVAEELHENRQGNTGANELRGICVSQLVRDDACGDACGRGDFV